MENKYKINSNLMEKVVESETMRNIVLESASSKLLKSIEQRERLINSAHFDINILENAFEILKSPPLDNITSNYTKILSESPINIASIGVSSNLVSLIEQKSKLIESVTSSSNIITSALCILKNPLLKDINSKYIKTLSKSTTNIVSAGISSKLVNSIQQISQQINEIDFKCIKINSNGTINYSNKNINMDEVVGAVNSYLEEDSPIESKIEKIVKKSKGYNPIIIIIVFSLFIIPLINVFNQSNSMSKHNYISDEITESINNLNEDVVCTLDKVANVLGIILICGKGLLNSVENFDSNHPVIFDLIKYLMEYLIRGIYKFVKKRKINIKVIEDKKRKINFIKQEVINLVKNEFQNPIIDNILIDNFGLIIANDVEIRTNNTFESPIVYKMRNFGEVVVILETDDDWAKIKFDGEDNKTYIGWMFASYIERVNS
ncbi:SH3 domain-containing protein [Clostridium senegalense]|uniref:SH3 domain-containing protein n=1 Tax=Clostridium senegalense TaxID=1465809 RepID=UPI00028939DC|nr:SH3 domain-containing protein [Clostridium senegalense]